MELILFLDYPSLPTQIKRTLIMYKGLVIARKPEDNNNEILFTFKDSNGETIEIKQTITEIIGQAVRIRIEAPEDVMILTGELIKPTPELMEQE